MVFNWNDDKNKKLKSLRGISFEDVVIAIENGDVLEVLENLSTNYNHQVIIVIKFQGYAYAVPTVVSEEEYFFKTIFPSRKYTALYLTKEDNG